ncbi:hypothetical protein [Chitinophaga sp. Cy-1792]|uniref:hypothetical protein n=1 Tax=Chitinophaga sp. Cy-1792 TaxID=2608339 RepID=UPI001420C9EE|nr:hypothetical protein [Chitinophaga sp. Cy-1792]NIG52588.1 hypothetical protein [Chitinophaga sp. Cy-1792]
MTYYVLFTRVEYIITRLTKMLRVFAIVEVLVIIVLLFIPFLRVYAVIPGGLLLIIPIIGAFIKSYKEAGQCLLTDDDITITTLEGTCKYQLTAIDNILFFYGSYYGQNYARSVSEGVDNYISFSHHGERVKATLLLLPEHIPAMNRLFALWQQKEIDYMLKTIDDGSGKSRYLTK